MTSHSFIYSDLFITIMVVVLVFTIFKQFTAQLFATIFSDIRLMILFAIAMIYLASKIGIIDGNGLTYTLQEVFSDGFNAIR